MAALRYRSVAERSRAGQREGGSASSKHGGREAHQGPAVTRTRNMPLLALGARVIFYPSLLYTVLMEQLTRRQWYHRIDETVLLGALPFRGMSQTLINEENVRGVITMNEEYETRLLCNSAEQWEALGVEQLRLSTVDFTGVPTLEHLQKGVKFVQKHQLRGDSVYIHCKAGRSRSATMVAAYLIQRYKWEPKVAAAFIADIRPHIVIRPRQFLTLEMFYCLVTNSGAPENGG
ncbi:phosphatidylglycerophosphatase and protein-tyrosine phosphatase 1 [Ascaphus truei]|uniref:phosphatidylglycerophosphatase and protein-tyrosine phosphatase 1 n=1 Tax=Ascaphus truei TaxID=8439 RepID=UPI003F5939AA